LGLPFDYHCFGIQKTANTQSLFQRAQKMGVRFHYADAFFSDFSALQKELMECIEKSEQIY
jgi:hypothetical protein